MAKSKQRLIETPNQSVKQPRKVSTIKKRYRYKKQKLNAEQRLRKLIDESNIVIHCNVVSNGVISDFKQKLTLDILNPGINIGGYTPEQALDIIKFHYAEDQTTLLNNVIPQFQTLEPPNYIHFKKVKLDFSEYQTCGICKERFPDKDGVPCDGVCGILFHSDCLMSERLFKDYFYCPYCNC